MPRCRRLAKTAASLVFCLVVAFAIELAVFNAQTLTSLANREVEPLSERTYERTGDTYLEYVFTPSHIGNMRVQADLPRDFEGSAKLSIAVIDEGNENYLPLDRGEGPDLSYSRDTTFELEAAGRVRKVLVKLDPVVPKSAIDLNDPDLHARVRAKEDYAKLYRDAIADGLDADAAQRVAIDDALHAEEVEAAIPVSVSVSFNVVRPLEIAPYRILLMAATLLVALLLLPRSTWWSRRIDGGAGTAASAASSASRLAWAVGAVGALFFVFMLVAHLGYVDASLANERQYFHLARALAHGSVALDERPSAQLLAMANPYDSVARALAGVPYLWDHAFFHGRYYVYFGVLPVLLYHLPFYLLTGQMFPNALADAISGVAACLGLARLLLQLCRRFSPRCSRGMFAVCYLALYLGSWVLFAGLYPGHYVLPIVTGLACLIWGLALWLRAIVPVFAGAGAPAVALDAAEPRPGISVRPAVAGSLLVALTLLCRPQLLLGAVLGIVFLAQAVRVCGLRRSLRPALLALAPFVLVAAAACWYNAARFGSPFDFGANYNLTGDDMTHRGFALSRLPLGLFAYLFQPPSMSVAHPFLRSTALVTSTAGATVSEPMHGGLFALVPLLLAPLALAVRSVRARVPAAALPIVGAGLLLAPILAAFDANGAGILPRYLMDMGIFPALAAVPCLLALDGSLRGRQVARLAALASILLLALLVI